MITRSMIWYSYAFGTYVSRTPSTYNPLRLWCKINGVSYA